MKLEDIEPQSFVFIDANIFIYHFTGVSEDCSDFLARCERGELNGVTSMNVILEVMHRLMMVEAIRKRLIQPPKILQKLREKPEKICQLQEYFINTMTIFDMGIKIYSVTQEVLKSSQIFRTQYGLMVNDSLIVAIMQEEGIQKLASNDDEFSRISEVKLFRPADVRLTGEV